MYKVNQKEINMKELEVVEDIELFKKYQATKKFDENGNFLQSDQKIRNELANRNAKLVTFVINKFYSKRSKHKALRSDLLQEGHIGLFDAIDGFKPELGFKFSTYATWWIRQSINSYLLDEEPMFHIPSHIRTARNKLQNFVKENSIPVNQISKEILEEIGMTEKMYASIEAADKTKNWNHVCLDMPISSSGETTGKSLRDVIPSNISDFSMDFDNKKLISATIKSFKKLNMREKHILLERYGFDSSKILKNTLEGDK
jgi:RNA polymerase nonessential primary-like sigma factor